MSYQWFRSEITKLNISEIVTLKKIHKLIAANIYQFTVSRVVTLMLESSFLASNYISKCGDNAVHPI